MKKVIGGISIEGNTLLIDSKNVIRSINDNNADINGNIDLDVYKKSEILELFSTIPVSRYGQLNYLPLSISGSYEGSTLYGIPTIPMIVENDGTLVWIRRGTNGSNYGHYYNYINDVYSYNSYSVVSTTTKYRLNNTNIIEDRLEYFIPSNFRDVMVGYLINPSDDYIFIDTEGTMNKDNHRYCTIPRSMIDSTICYAFYHNEFCYIIGNKVGNTRTTPFGFCLYRILISDIKNNSVKNVEKIKNFNGTGIYGQSYNNIDDIRATSKQINYISENGFDDDAFYNIDNTKISINFFHHGSWLGGLFYKEDNIIKYTFDNYSHIYMANRSNGRTSGIQFRLDLDTFEFEYDTNNNMERPHILDYNNTIVHSPNTFLAYNYLSHTDNKNSFITLSNTDIVFLYLNARSAADYGISYREVITDKKMTDFIPSSQFSTVRRSLLIQPQFGSSIGSYISNPHIFSKDAIMIASTGKNENNKFVGVNSRIFTHYSGEPTYEYNSLNSGTLLGFPPNTYRKYISNAIDFRFLMGIYEGEKVTTHNTWYSSVSNTFKMQINIDPDTLEGTSINHQPESINKLCESFIDKILLDNKTTYPVRKKIYSIYHDPDTKVGYGFILILLNTPANTTNLYRYSFDCKFDIINNTISNYQPNNYYNHGSGSNYTDVNNSNDYAWCGGFIRFKVENNWKIMYVASISHQNVGDANFNTVICDLNDDFTIKPPVNNRFTSYRTSYYTTPTSRRAIGYLPNYGFGFYHMTSGITDFTCKCVFRLYGNTEKEYQNFLEECGMGYQDQKKYIKDIVICSQDVPQNFNIYFNENVPVFLNGRYFIIPQVSFNLAELFPNVYNKTFYVYIVQRGTYFTYDISDKIIPETSSRMYIGYLKTNNENIETININKISRFDIYRPSLLPRGMSIPVTDLPPTTANPNHWV